MNNLLPSRSHTRMNHVVPALILLTADLTFSLLQIEDWEIVCPPHSISPEQPGNAETITDHYKEWRECHFQQEQASNFRKLVSLK
jgi:hypothetical protein